MEGKGGDRRQNVLEVHKEGSQHPSNISKKIKEKSLLLYHSARPPNVDKALTDCILHLTHTVYMCILLYMYNTCVVYLL